MPNQPRRDWRSRLHGRDSTCPPAYAALALFHVGRDTPQLMSDAKGRVVVFDTEDHARHFAPLLRDGCAALWNSAEDYLWWVMPDGTLPAGGLRGAAVVTDYDVYNLPPNHPVLSEARQRDWKRHVHYAAWMREMQEAREKERPTPVLQALRSLQAVRR